MGAEPFARFEFMNRVLPRQPVPDLAAYLDVGGGAALERARAMEPGAIIDRVRQSGLRGRGGAGFPTGLKWQTAAQGKGPAAVVVNAAEGEPGTMKDRAVLEYDPYRVLEGLAIAAKAIGATTAIIGIKARFIPHIDRLTTSASEMEAAGMLDGIELRLVEGPDDYLFGVETALLEVIEGRDPLPRVLPPYLHGLVGSDGTEMRTVVNNVETLANIPGILAEGSGWFRSLGTDRSPGSMLFTVSGDVQTPAVVELPLGTPLSYLIYGVGGGLPTGRRPKLVVSGVSNRPLSEDELDTPLSYEGMEAIGSGLGSGGFIVYDDTTCAVEVGAALSGFLQRGSCGQCPPCKLGTTAFTSGFSAVLEGRSDLDHVERLTAWISRVTDANRCGLGAGQRALAGGILDTFAEDVIDCLEGRCPGHRGLVPPAPVDHDPSQQRPVIVFAS